MEWRPLSRHYGRYSTQYRATTAAILPNTTPLQPSFYLNGGGSGDRAVAPEQPRVGVTILGGMAAAVALSWVELGP